MGRTARSTRINEGRCCACTKDAPSHAVRGVSVEVCRELSSSCRAILSTYCRVSVEFPVELSRPGLKCTRRRPQGIVPSSEVSSVIGEFIFYCVRQILWARLMRYIVWEDCGSRSRCGIPHRQVYPPIPAPKRETVPRSVTSLKPLSAL